MHRLAPMRVCIAALLSASSAALRSLPVRRLEPLGANAAMRMVHARLKRPLRASTADSAAPSKPAASLRAAASATAWAASAAYALGTYKPERIAHNAVGVAQALTALPLIAAAAQAPDDRRLALAWAAASAWSVAGVVFAPAMTRAFVRGTSHPVRYPPTLAAAVIVLHVFAGVGAARSWRRAGGTPDTAVSGVLRGVEDTHTSTAAVELSFCARAFAVFAAGAILAPFPVATLPSLLGKRMARAFGAWHLVGAAACLSLRDAVAEGRADAARPLKRGLRALALVHVALACARPVVDGMHLYPAATACAPAWAATLLVYGVLVDGVRRC